jgi:hypothetical protein
MSTHTLLSVRPPELSLSSLPLLVIIVFFYTPFRLILMSRHLSRHPLVLFDQASTDFLLSGDTPETRQRLLSSLFRIHTAYHLLLANGDSSTFTQYCYDKVETALDALFNHFGITSFHLA